MLRIGKIIGEKALLLLELQMNGEINLIHPKHTTVGDIIPLVQDNPKPNCDGTRVNGKTVHSIGGINLT
jgi:hypothetical protein